MSVLLYGEKLIDMSLVIKTVTIYQQGIISEEVFVTRKS